MASSPTDSAHTATDLEKTPMSNELTIASIMAGKEESVVTVVPILTSQGNTVSWKPTWKRVGALSGLMSLLLAFASIFASLAILKTSDGAAINSWQYQVSEQAHQGDEFFVGTERYCFLKYADLVCQPSTFLAVVTAIANQAVRYAAIQGAVIAWWLRAIKGSTLAKLHYDWSMSDTPWRSLVSRKTCNWLVLPFFASILVAVDGPLLQRASKVISTPILDTPIDLEITMSPEVPRGFSGYYQYSPGFNTFDISSGRSSDYAIANSQNISVASNEWIAEKPPSGFVSGESSQRSIQTLMLWTVMSHLEQRSKTVEGCPGRCRAKVQAPALATESCTETTHESNYLGLSPLENFQHVTANPPINNVAFMVDIGLLPGREETINLTIVYSRISTATCSGTIIVRSCLLRSAVGMYAITIDNGAVSLDSPSEPEILMSANNTLVTSGSTWPVYKVDDYTQSTLAGIVGTGFLKYEVSTTGCCLLFLDVICYPALALETAD